MCVSILQPNARMGSLVNSWTMSVFMYCLASEKASFLCLIGFVVLSCWRTILSIAVVHPNSFSIVTACNALLVCGTDPWNSVASWSVEQAKFYLFTQIMKNGGLKSQNFPNSRKGGSKFYIFFKLQSLPTNLIWGCHPLDLYTYTNLCPLPQPWLHRASNQLYLNQFDKCRSCGFWFELGTHTQTHTDRPTDRQTDTHRQTHTYICIYMYIHTQLYILQICVYIYIHIYVHTYIAIHTHSKSKRVNTDYCPEHRHPNRTSSWDRGHRSVESVFSQDDGPLLYGNGLSDNKVFTFESANIVTNVSILCTI